jgi:hypothetical protein
LRILLYAVFALLASAFLLSTGTNAVRYIEYHLLLAIPPLMLLVPGMHRFWRYGFIVALGISLWRNYEGIERILVEPNNHRIATEEGLRLQKSIPNKEARLVVAAHNANRMGMWYGGYRRMLFVLQWGPGMPAAAIRKYRPDYIALDGGAHYARQEMLGRPVAGAMGANFYVYNPSWADSLAADQGK